MLRQKLLDRVTNTTDSSDVGQVCNAQIDVLVRQYWSKRRGQAIALNVVKLTEANSIERHLEIVQDALGKLADSSVEWQLGKLRISHRAKALPVIRQCF